MSQAKKPKAAPETTQKPSKVAKNGKSVSKSFDPRDGLIVYIERPEENPEGRVVEYDDDFVLIRDKYPKAR
jgi:aprataxin